MFVVLDGGVSLPVPAKVGTDPFLRGEGITDHRWKEGKQERWLNAYTHCLYSLGNNFDAPVHKAVIKIARGMLGVEEPLLIALRFLGEMEIAGYLTLHKQKMKGSKDKAQMERIIIPTDKMLGLELGGLKNVPDSVVKMPAVCGKDYLSKSIVVRHGVSSKKNKEVAAVTRDMADERFTINDFILDLMKAYPPHKDTIEEHLYAFSLERTMNTAEQLREQTFRFGYFLDSRSRMYPDTTCGVSPQGADYEKALLLPTYAEPLTPKGVEALISAAWGYSEIEWDMAIMIRHARSPEEFRLEWMTADKPFCYMACAKLLEMYDNDPESSLPAFAPLDGRCSGLQHWSALTRSRAITAHLGMEPEEHELDIYEKVAEDWAETLTEANRVYATRKAAKVPVMTWGYNATRMTSMEHLDSMFGQKRKWSRTEKAFVVVEEGLERATAGRLGCDLYDNLKVTLSDLAVAVEWVSECATKISKAGNCDIHWPTPDGFECKQRKLVGVPVTLEIYLSNDERFTADILDYSGQKPAHGKHRSAIAPNVIHSLDATHLRMVARRLAALGLPMIFIHDSFATHVNHRDVLYREIVDTFAELYSGNWLATLQAYWTDRYGLEFDAPPAQGGWDPETTKVLKRFFL